MIAALVMLVALQAADVATVSFVVHAPGPDTSSVRVVGSAEALGRWDHRLSLVLRPSGQGQWMGQARVTRGASFAFNVVRGDWEGHALRSDGALLHDAWCTVHDDTVIVVTVHGWDDLRCRSVRGTVVPLGPLRSTLLPQPHEVWVVLPRSYDQTLSERYPVLFVHDGQDAFDATRSSTGTEWGVDEIADSLSQAGIIPEIIVVAIGSTQYRTYEYADTALGEAYARFLVEELKPLVDRTFRTRAERTSTATVGYSLGGLISLLTAWWHPHAVGIAACLSPVLEWGDGKVLARLREVPSARPRLYFSVGEGGMEELLQPVVASACSVFSSQGWSQDVDLRFARSRSWRLGGVDPQDLAEALRFAFGEAAPPTPRHKQQG